MDNFTSRPFHFRLSVDLSFQSLIDEPKTDYKSIYWADLRGVRLEGASLNSTILRRADLRKARLDKATLFDSDLWKANLDDASLVGSKLRFATLSDARWRSLWNWLLRQSDEDQETQQRQDETQAAGHEEDGDNDEGPHDR